MGTISSIAGDDAAGGIRFDRYASERMGGPSRSQLKARGSFWLVNGKIVKPSRLIFPGDRIELRWDDPEPSALIPENLDLSVLYEDDRVLVVDKVQGLVVHPGAGNPRGTLANAVLFRSLRSSSGRSSSLQAAPSLRSGIVHRLDKDTSGVIIAAYDEETLAFLAGQFKSRTTRKLYVALVVGAPPRDRGRIEGIMGRDPKDRKLFTLGLERGKTSLTLYKVIERFDGFTFLALLPKTGRTHQLRVHLRSVGCPILGDPLYGKKNRTFPEATLMLHAYKLRIRLPGSSEGSTFVAPLPNRFKTLLSILRRRKRHG